MNLEKHLTQSDQQILQSRTKTFVSKFGSECYNNFLNAKSKLEEKLLERESLLDFGRKNAFDLTLSKSFEDIPNMSVKLMDLNNEINLLYMSLEYQKNVLVQLFGEDPKYSLPNINKVF